MNSSESIDKTIGILLIGGALLLFLPYTLLTFTFEYPQILRQETAIILTKFYEGGSSLVFTWWTFAIVGLPLLGAYVSIGQKLERKISFVRFASVLGITGLIFQMIGLLRWTFVVPVLAQNYVLGNAMVQEASKVAFQIVHQYGGVVLGEHLGPMFTIVWTIMMSVAFARLRLFPGWVAGFGVVSSLIYILAQAELFTTVIPDFPVWDLAGFVGSSLWLIWLLVVGMQFISLGRA